jgi:hypothetical protein
MKAFLRIAIVPFLLMIAWLAKAHEIGYAPAAMLVVIWAIMMIPIGLLMNKLCNWLYKD